MAATRPFPDMLARFLTTYLPVTRACSRNTICAYRDAFTLFLRFMDQRRATSPDKVSFADFTTTNVAPQMKETVAIASSALQRCKPGALTRSPLRRA